MKRLLAFKGFLWFLLGAAAVVALFRFARGLGAATALTDLTPWGFWIGFDVMGGVALAAGGFVVAATVYVLRLERFRAVVRPAVLTAFLGYLAVVVALLFDLGLPWNIWHMIVFWNPRSPLFEVGWCVMLYTLVLSLEFGPVVLEATRHTILQTGYRVLKKATVPLVILGIMLSTLHQSSLGSLFLIMPHRIHPLWYTPILPVLFFVSAIGLALMTVMAESLISAYLYEKEPEMDLLRGLGKAGAWALAAYGALRLGDVAARGQLGAIFAGTFSSWLFVVEVLVSAVIPAALLFLPGARRSRVGLSVASGLAILGFVLNRLDVGGLAMVETTGTRYFPSWMEVVISAGVVGGVALAYFFVAERFHLFHAGRVDMIRFKHTLPGFDRGTWVLQPDPYRGGISSNSLMAVLGAAIALAFLPESAIKGDTVPPRPVRAPGYGPTIILDGDQTGEAVRFDHRKHVEREGGPTSCGRCHHLLRPGEQATGCARCHRDMYRASTIFDHALHASRLDRGEGCTACHTSVDEPKDLDHGKPCLDCHTKMVAADATLLPKGPPRIGSAPGYVAALHGLCIPCHKERRRDGAASRAGLAECANCHETRQFLLDPERPDDRWHH